MTDAIPKIRQATITVVYADGSSRLTVIKDHFDLIEGEAVRAYDEFSGSMFKGGLMPSRHEVYSRLVFDEIPPEAITTTMFLSDEMKKSLEVQQMAAKDIAAATVSLVLEPAWVPPELKYKHGDLVRMPARYNKPGTPHKKEAHVWEITEIFALPLTGQHGKMSYQFKIEDRDRKTSVTFMRGSAIYDSLQKVDAWPLRRGDFVRLKACPGMIRKVTGRQSVVVLDRPAVKLVDQLGREGWNYEDNLEVIDVKVAKTETWTPVL